ncbi:MAG TPA: hypothetical protein VF992_01545 [Thermoplasmata archaeon]
MKRQNAMELLIGLAVVALLAPSPLASASNELLQQSVSFGLPRTDADTWLALSATCGVIANYEHLSLTFEESVDTFVNMAPDSCEITAYVLGVAVPLPILNSTPLGRKSYKIPGVQTVTLGLVDLSVDLVTSLTANRNDTDPEFIAPSSLSWPAWGMNVFPVTDRFDGEKEALLVYEPQLSFSLGASVFVLGVRIYGTDIVHLGDVVGTPSVAIPISGHRAPASPLLVIAVVGTIIGPAGVGAAWIAHRRRRSSRMIPRP